MYTNKSMRSASNANSLTLLVFIVLLFALVAVRDPICNLLIPEDAAHRDAIIMLISFLLQYVVCVPAALLVFRFLPSGRALQKEPSCFCKPKMPAGWVVKWLVISMFFVYGTSYISTMLSYIIQSISGIELNSISVTDISTDNGVLSKFTTVLSVMFLAPIFEELLFRVMLVRNAGRYSSWAAIVSMGIMFGLWHMNYTQTLYTAMLGICAGFLLIKTHSVIPPLLLHFTINTIGTCQSLSILSIDYERLLSSLDNNEFGYLSENIGPLCVILLLTTLVWSMIITGLVLFIIEIKKHKDSFRLDTPCPEVRERSKFAVYFTAPLTIIVTIVLLGITVINAIPA